MGLEGLGPLMSMEESAYVDGAPFKAGVSGKAPASETPGFDSELLPNPQAIIGRWVRSPSKFVGWDAYMEFFGMTGDKALQETEEPQEHVIKAFSKDKLHIVHRLPWRDGLDTEYVVPLDGSVQPVPPAMVARASSSWKVNELMTWVHSWDEGDDGNPLHRGLRTDQKMKIGGVDYTLRYWRNLIRPNEMRINVEVTYADSGKKAIHTQRYFHKIDVERDYAIASLPVPEATGCPVPSTLSCWTHNGRAVRIAMLPHASNMPDGWEKLPEEKRWELAEPFPKAGRDSGAFLAAVRSEAAAQKLWMCVGVVLRSPSADEKDFDYVINLDKTSGAKLGIDCDYGADGKYVEIEGINEGLVQTWNSNNPDKQVEVTDRIVEVNGIGGSDSALFDEMMQEKPLEVKLKRKRNTAYAVLSGVALVGADGWLHGVHTDAGADARRGFSKGTGEWPATQRGRPLGVYDTELGRIAVLPSSPDLATVEKLKGMGAELVLSPMTPCESRERDESRVAVKVPEAPWHDYYTKYEVCGPEPLDKPVVEIPFPIVVQPKECELEEVPRRFWAFAQAKGAGKAGATGGYA